MASINLYEHVMDRLAALTDAVELYLDWASEPGDDDCPDELIEQLCSAQEAARDLLDGLGYGEDGN